MNWHQVETFALERLELFEQAIENADECVEDPLDVVGMDDVLQVALDLGTQVKFSLNKLKFGILGELLHDSGLSHCICKVKLLR